MYICEFSCFNTFCFCFRQNVQEGHTSTVPFQLSYLQKNVFRLLVIIWIVRPISLSDLNSSHRDVIPFITVIFCVFVYVLVHYMQSRVNVPCHRVKAVQIVKQTSKEMVYTIQLNDINITVLHESMCVFKYQIRCIMSTWWFL